LKKDLVRLGSATGCEICVGAENLPPHALSLEVTGDQCRVHNRTEKSITCAGKPLAPRAAASWPLDAELEVVPGLVLRIEKGEAAVSAPARPAWEEESLAATGEPLESAPAQTKPATPAKSSQSAAQLVITMACLGASALLLWNKFSPRDGSASSKRTSVTLNQVLDKLEAAPAEQPWLQIRQAIQEGYRLDRSGDAAAAKMRYARVVQMILSRTGHEQLRVPESGDLPVNQRRQLNNLASQLSDELDRTVFVYAMNRL
jgi:hypothetical protein